MKAKENFKKLLEQMSASVIEMVELTYKGLMENDAHYLNRALNKEHIIDDLEKEITAGIIQIAKDLSSAERKELMLFEQIAENIERMGDELRSLIERIELKIAEKLYFSDIGIDQYIEVFSKMQGSVKLVEKFLSERKSEILDAILKNGEDNKKLIEEYRALHLERLTKGICDPRASNMYFDMLDFTGNIARHCTNIARIHKEK